jgi:hypothetical protein
MSKNYNNDSAGYQAGFIAGQRDAKIKIFTLQTERDAALAESRALREELDELSQHAATFVTETSRWFTRHD